MTPVSSDKNVWPTRWWASWSSFNISWNQVQRVSEKCVAGTHISNWQRRHQWHSTVGESLNIIAKITIWREEERLWFKACSKTQEGSIFCMISEQTGWSFIVLFLEKNSGSKLTLDIKAAVLLLVEASDRTRCISPACCDFYIVKTLPTWSITSGFFCFLNCFCCTADNCGTPRNQSSHYQSNEKSNKSSAWHDLFFDILNVCYLPVPSNKV